jgi:uncharacterized protein YfdQ (DUF2303 family)
MVEQKDQQGWPVLNMGEIANLGRTLQDVRWIGGKPFVVAPRDTALFDLESFAEEPSSKRANVVVDRVQSLSSYVKEYAGQDGSTMAFADLQNALIQVVLDYHRPVEGQPRWCEHTAMFTLTETREWKQWTKMNERPMPQVEFAEFLEDRVQDVIAPPSADLFSLVQTLEAKRNVNFASAVRLEDGTASITYEDNLETSGKKANGGKGKVEVPPTITLGIRPFEGLERWEVKARLRYRLVDGGIKFWYSIIEPDRVREAAFEDQVHAFEGEVGLNCIRGRLDAKPQRDRAVKVVQGEDH